MKQDRVNPEVARAPHIWLAAMGVATNLGSEPMVGMQWVKRMRARGPVTVLTSAVFRDPAFLSPEHWAGIVFIDTRADSPADYASNFARHLWRWWRGVRAHLKAHAQPQDRLLIVAPAAIWILPWVGGLPIARDRIFFGPMGADWVPREIRGSRWPGFRNLRTVASIALWRMFAPWLPSDLALRAPFPGFEAAIGSRFRLLATLPEVEPPPMEMVTREPDGRVVGLLHDDRPRKRFEASFALALALAAERQLPLAVVGTSGAVAAELRERAKAEGVVLALVPRMDRAAFQAWLTESVSDFVSLSNSEGVPSTLIEALLAGCRLHVHDVGGIHWLVRCGTDLETAVVGGACVVSFRWDAASLAAYAADSAAMFEELLDRLQGELAAVASS